MKGIKSMGIVDSFLGLVGASGFMYFLIWSIIRVIESDVNMIGKIMICWLLSGICVMLSGVIFAIPFIVNRRIHVISRYKRIKMSSRPPVINDK